MRIVGHYDLPHNKAGKNKQKVAMALTTIIFGSSPVWQQAFPQLTRLFLDHPSAFPTMIYAEIREPEPQHIGSFLADKIDLFHKDYNVVPGGGEINSDFDMILWSNKQPSEIIKTEDCHLTKMMINGYMKTRGYEKDPSKILYVNDGDLVLINNDDYLHRQPKIDISVAQKRWFARFWIEKGSFKKRLK